MPTRSSETVNKALIAESLGDIPKDMIITKIKEHRGDMMQVATDLNLSYFELERFIYKDYKIGELILGYRIGLIDKAETVLRNHLDAQSFKAATFVLRTLGKNRGYMMNDEPAPKRPDDQDSKSIDLSTKTPEELRKLRALLSSDAKVVEGHATLVKDDPADDPES